MTAEIIIFPNQRRQDLQFFCLRGVVVERTVMGDDALTAEEILLRSQELERAVNAAATPQALNYANAIRRQLRVAIRQAGILERTA